MMRRAVRALAVPAAAMSVALLLISAAPSRQPPAARRQAAKRAATLVTEEVVAPVSLSDPDGQELTLEQMSIRTAIEGMLSLTEMEIRFHNPHARRIEGRFSCVLPPRAAISRFAKEVNGQLMEGEVVERLRANQVYEQFLHRMRDPALLEQDQGNRFSARIFPIEAGADVRLVLSFTELLPLKDGVRRWQFPLRGLPRVGRLTFRAVVSPLPGEAAEGNGRAEASLAGDDPKMTASHADVYTFEERDSVPERDLEIRLRATTPRPQLIRAGDFYLAALHPSVIRRAAAAPHDWLFLVDTSASSAESADNRIRAMEQLLSAMPPDDRVTLECFDHGVTKLESGSADAVARSAAGRLRARQFLGGTDFGSVLRRVAASSKEDPGRAVVIASDFVPTLGVTDRSQLTAAAARIASGTPVHALVLGSREDAAMARLVTTGRGRVVRVPFTASLERSARAAAAALAVPAGATVDVADASAEWIYPQQFTDIHAGDEVIVLGRLRPGAEPRITIGGVAADVAGASLPAGTYEPLLEREAYRAYLDYLAEREAAEPAEAVRRALAAEQVRVSCEKRVVIPRTTMLVLETESDYQRFGLDRRALAAILTIDAGGIARIDRQTATPVPIARAINAPPPPRLDRSPSPVSEPRLVEKSDSAKDEMSAPAAAMERRAARNEAVSVTAEAPRVAGTAQADRPAGMVGNVVGGVVGGVVVGAVDPLAVAPSAVPQRVAERVRSDAAWSRPQSMSQARIEELRERIARDPRDREPYNQLSDALFAAGEWTALRRLALDWQRYDSENPQVYEVLGLADERLGREEEAVRAYASLIEIAPAQTELLQRAGLLLVRAHRASLAEAPLRRALEVRPDRANGYRHLALMLWLDGRPDEAARVLESATRQTFPGWYGNVQRVLREELAYVYRALIAASPARRAEIEDRARDHGADLSRRDALRATIAWETDANDVDLHAIDPGREECYYGHRENRSGLELYEDITQGLGPEVIRAARVSPGTYHFGVRYFAAGPMGVSRGILVVVRPASDRMPSIDIVPFRLVEGGGEIRHIAAVTVK